MFSCQLVTIAKTPGYSNVKKMASFPLPLCVRSQRTVKGLQCVIFQETLGKKHFRVHGQGHAGTGLRMVF